MSQTGDRCHSIHGFDLYNETSETVHLISSYQYGIDGIIDWGYLQGGKSTLKGLIGSYLKGNLFSNVLVLDYLCVKLFDIVPFSYAHMLEQMHDLRVTPYDDWNKQDWLCSNCIVDILKTHLHLWLLLQKKKGESFNIIRAAQ